MTSTYKIVRDSLGGGFVVEVTAPGSFLSVRGFPNEAAAQAWIVEQQRRDAAAVHPGALPGAQSRMRD